VKPLSKKKTKMVELIPPDAALPENNGKFHFSFLNEYQKDLFLKIQNPQNEMIVIAGEAGTSKSFIAITAAIQALLGKRIKKIHMTRPCVHTGGDEHGFIPGTLTDKLQPWLMPLLDNVEQTCPINGADFKKVQEALKFEPLGMLRGRTFNECYVIADEMSNATFHQMMTVATRHGRRCKTIFTGDAAQSDIKNSGFMQFYNLVEGLEGVLCYTMPPQAQTRNPIVSKILERQRYVQAYATD
jgi:phosphate starvation-inducible PhoH-like protein